MTDHIYEKTYRPDETSPSRSKSFLRRLRPRRLLRVVAITTILPTIPVVAAAQPWQVGGDTRVDRTDIRFESDGAILEGTLHYPAGGHAGPALVVAHGATTPERDSWLYLHLTEGLPGVGLAVFVYDRRGTGESEGDVQLATYDDLADDILAAADAIGGHRAVDRDQVGVWGASQGGWLAMEAAARGEISFVINVVGPMVTPAEQMYFAVQNAMILGGFEQEEVERAVSARRAVDQWVRGEMHLSDLTPILDYVEVAPWAERTLGVPSAAQLPQDPGSLPWAHDMDYDPVQALRVLEAKGTPVLIVYGGADPLVPVQESLDVLEAFHPHNADWLEVRVIAEADHVLMFPDDPDFMDADAAEAILNSRGPESAQYFMIMGVWIESRLHLTAQRGGNL